MKQYIYIITLTIMAFWTTSVCMASDSPEELCKQWAEKAHNEVHTTAIDKRYRKVLEQVAQGCPLIPKRLRIGAKESLRDDGDVSRRKLMEAAAPWFHPSCSKQFWEMPAIGFDKKCAGEFHGTEFLNYIDAATFMFGRALDGELKKIRTNLDHRHALIKGFFLANQHYWKSIDKRAK